MKTNQTNLNATSKFNVRPPTFDVPRSAIPCRAKAKRRRVHLPSLAAPKPSGGGSILALLGLTMLFAINASAATRYVWQGSPSPAPPYDSWASAATVIQDAVDAADPGDTVLVTNGVYATGEKFAGSATNRVAVDKPLAVESVNGPQSTVIFGSKTPQIRCVYLTNGARLSGFTLTNGAATYGGALRCGSTSAVATNCVLTGNSAYNGGGGAYSGTLNNCTVSGNSAYVGGGASDSTLNNCTVSGNSAYEGGGAFYGTLNNCTVTGNSADYYGGGASGDTLNNCIVYYNSAPNGPNYSYSTFAFSCTRPLPTGPGNIDSEPLLASSSHLSAQSPCIGRGSSAYSSGVDIDGESWLSPPCMGADQFVAGQATGGLTMAITVAYTNVATEFAVAFVAQISGRLTASVWDFGDGVVVSNRPYASHAWTTAGLYEVHLTGYNESWPGGVSATVQVLVEEREVYYVNGSNAAPEHPFTNWVTAATNIQDAIDVGTQIGRLVLVADGVYATGEKFAGSDTNRVVVDQPLTVASVSGPQSTVILGSMTPQVRCVYLANGASLSGFTLTNGAAAYGGALRCESASAVATNCVLTGNSASGDGGGAYCGTLNYCTLIGNSATFIWGGVSGGASRCTLNHCTLIGNRAPSSMYTPGFGGAFGCTLNHCTLVDNSAVGTYECTLNHCIVYFNGYWNDFGSSTFNYCCTAPLPAGGVGNIDLDPLFVDTNGWSNLRLQSNSPCINAGNNAYVTGLTDLDGNPRIVSGTVDMGAYEYQGPGSVISYAWLQHYGLPTDGSADTLDSDLDGHNTWQEWKAWTDPTNALSVLKLLTPQPDTNGTVVTWQSVLGQSYSVERATNASGPFSLLQGNVPGQSGTTSVTDTNPADANPILYRVAVPE